MIIVFIQNSFLYLADTDLKIPYKSSVEINS